MFQLHQPDKQGISRKNKQHAGEVDIERQALVEDAPWRGSKRFGDGKVVSIETVPEKVVLSVEAGQEAFLVLSEVFYPLRWKVRVNGKEQRMFRTNGFLRGVLVPEGEHEVVFSYDRGGFENGKKLSFAGLAVGVLLAGTGLPGLRRWRQAK